MPRRGRRPTLRVGTPALQAIPLAADRVDERRVAAIDGHPQAAQVDVDGAGERVAVLTEQAVVELGAGDERALAEREELEQVVFLRPEGEDAAGALRAARRRVDLEVADANHGLLDGVRAPHERAEPRDQL